MQRIFLTKNNTVVIVYDDGTVDKPEKGADGVIHFMHPRLADPYTRSAVSNRFLEIEAGAMVYEE